MLQQIGEIAIVQEFFTVKLAQRIRKKMDAYSLISPHSISSSHILILPFGGEGSGLNTILEQKIPKTARKN